MSEKGSVWRRIAARLDLVRSTGARHASRRLRYDRALRVLVESRRERLAADLWRDAAGQVGATVTELGRGRFEIRRGSAATIVAGQTVPLNSRASMTLAADKPTAYERLAQAGIPVPEHLVFDATDTRAARSFLSRGPVPCVVKPAHGRGGDGVTGEICEAGDLRRAVLAARRFAARLLIERQIAGEVFRFLVLDGEVLDVVKRGRPVITGDGRSSVEDLIFAEYERRLGAEEHGLKPFAVDLDCLLTLKSAGVSLDYIVPAGAVLPIKTVTNFNRPDDNRTLRAGISAALRTEASAAAAALGLRVAGVDVITTAPGVALKASGGAVIDVNEAPALHHHIHVAEPKQATRVAVPILRVLLESPGRPAEQPTSAFHLNASEAGSQ